MILSWLAQVIGGQKNAKGAPRQRMGNPARPQQNQLQEGIELFKKMVAEQQQQNRQKQNTPKRGQQVPRQSPPPIQQARTAPANKSPQESRSQQKKSQKGQNQKQPRPETSRKSLGDEISRRHIPVETDLARHVVADAQQSLAKNSIADHVRNDLQNNVAAEVASHLGTSQGTTSPVTRSGLASSLRTSLGDRSRVAQAIVLSEILQPPVAMRKKS